MKARKLNSILKGNFYTRKNFLGVYPSCKIPETKKTKYCFISNTENHNEPGEHWVVWFIKNSEIFFFDSFGRSPYDRSFPHSFADLADQFKKCNYVSIPVQHPNTPWCGLHCMHFIYIFSIGLSVDDFLDDYEKNEIVSICKLIFTK